MSYDFDIALDRSNTSSSKWTKFPADVLPMWVADMDFAAPDFLLDSIKERLEHPILGYTEEPHSLVEAFVDWLAFHFGWHIPEEWVVFTSAVVPALNLACQTMQDGELIIPTPVYHPFLDLAENAGLQEIRVPMASEASLDGHGKRWSMDMDRLSAAVTSASRMVLICNPQNPTGRCYDADELTALAEFAERNDLILVSDEIHCSLTLREGVRHLPVAQHCPEIARRSISFFAATKAYNVPGVSCAAAVIPDEELRAKFMHARRGLVHGVGPLGYVAAETAFRDRGSWLPDLRKYLAGNLQCIEESLGGRLAYLEGTYLAWIDVSDLELDDTEGYFADHGLGISPGAQFGEPSHIRLNFGCPKSTLQEGLRRLNAAL